MSSASRLQELKDSVIVCDPANIEQLLEWSIAAHQNPGGITAMPNKLAAPMMRLVIAAAIAARRKEQTIAINLDKQA